MNHTNQLVIFCSLFVLFACNPVQENPPPISKPSVRVVTLKDVSGNKIRPYSAQIIPNTQVKLAFRTDGYIETITRVKGLEEQDRILQSGDKVKKGAILARVGSRQYQDSVNSAQAKLNRSLSDFEKAKKDYSRAKALFENKSLTAPDFDAAKRNYDAAMAGADEGKSRLDLAMEKLSDTELISPLDGIILERKIEEGSLVHMGSVGFVVADVETVKAQFGVPDVVLPRLTLGDPVSVFVASLPQVEYQGVITEIAQNADERTRVFNVSVQLDNAKQELHVGMVASISLDLGVEGQARVTVPLNAVVLYPPDGVGVYVVEKNNDEFVARLREIDPGPVLGNEILVRSGLQMGERVVVTGAGQLSDNQNVNVVP